MNLESMGIEVRCFNHEGKSVRGLEAANHGTRWQFVQSGTGNILVEFGPDANKPLPNQPQANVVQNPEPSKSTNAQSNT